MLHLETDFSISETSLSEIKRLTCWQNGRLLWENDLLVQICNRVSFALLDTVAKLR